MAENATISGGSKIVCTSQEIATMLEAENFSVTGASFVGVISHGEMAAFLEDVRNDMREAFQQRLQVLLKPME